MRIAPPIASPTWVNHFREWEGVFDAQAEREEAEMRGCPHGWRRVYVATGVGFFSACKVGFTGHLAARMWALSKSYRHLMEARWASPYMPLAEARLVERAAHNLLSPVWLRPTSWMAALDGSSEWFLCHEEDAVTSVAFALSQVSPSQFPASITPAFWIRPFRTKRLRGLEPWV